MELPKDPSVLVLLVATDGAKWIPEVLSGLRAQQHRPIDILAIDNASSDGSGDLLVQALGARRVVTLERRVGYGRALAVALKVASDRDARADAFLLMHDDASLESGALDAMLEAMRGDGIGIVGAKLLEWSDPTLLQDVGMTTDRYGRGVQTVERGELDSGQYEGVREVLYATSAAILIHRSVVETVGLFDLRYVALRDDLDLCWRARLAGIRTVVTMEASARHASAGIRALRASPISRRSRYFADRNLIATLIKNYSWPRLVVALPATIVISLLNAILFFFSGRRSAAVQVLEAVQWNAVHLPSTLRARHRAQHGRRVRDAEIIELMHRGATRLRAQLERAVDLVVGTVDEASDADVDAPPPRLIDRIRAHPGATAALAVTIVWLVGARTLLFTGQIAGADLAPFPNGARDLIGEFFSGWRGPAAGGAAPASPGLALLGVLTVICVGSAWLAQRALLLGLPVMGAVSMFRLVRALGLGPGARRVAVVTYTLSPLFLASFGAGRIVDLVVLVAAPGLVLSLLRGAGVVSARGWRDTAAGIAGCALATSLAPWSLVFVAGATVVLLPVSAARATLLRRGGVMIAGALALLFPWSIELFRAGSPFGFGGRDPLAGMRDLLGLSPSFVHPVPSVLRYGLIVAAICGVVVVRADRRRVASAFGVLGTGGLFIAWAVERGVPWIAPRASLPLVASAVAACVLAGLAFDEASTRLGARAFGRAHLLAGVVGVALGAQLAASGAWLGRGAFGGLAEAGTLIPSFVASEAERAGAFRVAWIGGTATSPTVDVTGPGGGTMRTYLARPAGAGASALIRATGAIVSGSTGSGGRLLATFGVRYVIVRPDADSAVATAIARQVDLGFSRRFHGAMVYRNEIGLPVAASVRAPGWVVAGARGLDAAAGAEPSPLAGEGFTQHGSSGFVGVTGARAKTVMLAQDYSSRWRARIDGAVAKPARSFGWATRFLIPPGVHRVRIDWTGQRRHDLMLLVQLLIVGSFVGSWSQRAARDRGER